MEKESFHHEKETLLESLKEEKRKVGEDKIKGMREIEKMKTELMSQQREVRREKQMYYIHKEIMKHELTTFEQLINLESSNPNLLYSKDEVNSQKTSRTFD